jgi:hypothetical protein
VRMLMAQNIHVILNQKLGGCDILSSWRHLLTNHVSCRSRPPPPLLVVLSAALAIVVDSVVSCWGWGHCCRIATPSDKDDGDLPFSLFFFQRREGVGRLGK